MAGFTNKPIVLWAEDSDDDAFLMERAFRTAELPDLLFRVPDGLQATKYLSGFEPFSDRQQYPYPSLLLLDIKMPFMSGFDVLAWKNSKPEFQELPVIVLTSSEMSRDIEEAFRLGASEYLVKPSTFEKLVEQVKQLHAKWIPPVGK